MQKHHAQLSELLADESFQRWISAATSADENKRWSEWLNSDPENKDLFDEARQLWNAVQFRPTSFTNKKDEWNRLTNRLKLKSKSPRSLKIARWRYVAIAASIFLIVLFWKQIAEKKQTGAVHFHKVTTEYGQRQDLHISERIHIILNANSVLQYPESQSQLDTIHMKLHGEAYFDVSPYSEITPAQIVIETQSGQIEVVGTKFVVYARGQSTKVVVEEGVVKIRVAKDNNGSKKNPSIPILLESGNLLKFRKGSSLLKPLSVNVEVHTSWKSDHLVFDNTVFQDIVQRLEDTYKIQIRVEDDALLKNTVSGSIENTNPDVIMQALAKALEVQLKKEDKTILFGNSTNQ